MRHTGSHYFLSCRGFLPNRRAAPPLANTKLYCLICERLAQSRYMKVERLGLETAIFRSTPLGESDGEGILKIGQYLAKLWTRV